LKQHCLWAPDCIWISVCIISVSLSWTNGMISATVLVRTTQVGARMGRNSIP
jgi:hypothetical protein